MERLTKRYNERTGTYEYIDAFSGAGILDTIVKAVTSNFAKNTAKTIATKALEAGVSKFGSEIGTRAANKVISTVDDKFSKVAKTKSLTNPKSLVIVNPQNVKIDDSGNESTKPLGLKDSNESFKPLGNVIMKELNKKSDNETINIARKKEYYGYGTKNKQFKSKLNKLLK